MATMSYCAVENTANDLQVVMCAIEESESIQDWYEERNQYEQSNVQRLRALCLHFLSTTEDINYADK